ncbi:CaiB/BaiF CoA transferase family protein [Corynebacterium pseudotuberculosis]|uniref:CaiB/BaiF CoA transferase family protein n=1 Tax=Corynebacterium pseudotuberculosis TaxID=1719 RepID=UPI0002660FD4|nr:CaiB/BaiF CoA-transferase family protein [Corynebacterium pseudotuberculosis]AFM07503.1 CoA transferase [Corynebacterium pseudotuberculosis Cp162]APG81728.1 CaiB/baiF CoA-transferase family protein [Corynebacterium pseudotuberculosis]WFP66332.1 CaiB/BaiF CoA-transferase family protein [Corynebacterium pseudotuberculosis]
MSLLPLDGITVVSMEQAVAAPFATRQLADLGARVIKIERDTGDFARTYDNKVHGDSSFFVWLNRTKESVVLDVKSKEGNDAIKKLISQADVFVSNLKPGAIERLGLGPEALHKDNPGLIHVSISGFGPGGSYSKKKAYDLIIQCESGMLSVTGTEEHPSKVGPSIADIASGMYAFSSILASIIQRSKSGKGAVHEISMLEALGEWMSQPHLFANYGGQLAKRSGASHNSIVPYGPFPAMDGQVFFGLQNEREWANFCSVVLDEAKLATNPKFTPNSARLNNRDELVSLISSKTKTLTSDELIERLERCNIATARLRNMYEYDAHPQLKERNRWREVETSTGRRARALLPSFLPVGVEPKWFKVPALGEHTNQVFKEFNL